MGPSRARRGRARGQPRPPEGRVSASPPALPELCPTVYTLKSRAPGPWNVTHFGDGGFAELRGYQEVAGAAPLGHDQALVRRGDGDTDRHRGATAGGCGEKAARQGLSVDLGPLDSRVLSRQLCAVRAARQRRFITAALGHGPPFFPECQVTSSQTPGLLGALATS